MGSVSRVLESRGHLVSVSSGFLVREIKRGSEGGSRGGGVHGAVAYLTVWQPKQCQLVVDLLLRPAEPVDVPELERAPLLLEAQLYREAEVPALGGVGLRERRLTGMFRAFGWVGWMGVGGRKCIDIAGDSG